MEQTDNTSLYKVVMANDEPYKSKTPYMISKGIVPQGWTEIGKQGTKQECISHVIDLAIGEVALNKEISNLIEKGKLVETKNLDREVRVGDTIVVDFDIKIILGNRKISFNQDKNVQMKLGEGIIQSEIEQELVGRKIGESIKITAKFPESYPRREIAGLDADYFIVINNIFDYQKYNNINEYMDEHNIKSLEDLKKTLIDKKAAWLELINKI